MQQSKKTTVHLHSDNFGRFIGTSKAMQDVYQQIRTIAEYSSNVLISGESGTGKELCAQSIHYHSNRSNKPFVPINCAAIPENLFESTLFGHIQGAFTSANYDRKGAIEQAEDGTLFLDEITEMSMEMQAKLLRFIQERTYNKVGSDKQQKSNVRIICASNCDIEEMIQRKEFREDLFFRLHVLPIKMPSLCTRRQDVLDLADYFLQKFSQSYQKAFTDFSKSAETALKNYDWPGNVRELKNVIEQIVIMNNATFVLLDMLPSNIAKQITSNYPAEEQSTIEMIMPLWRIEQNAIRKTIQLCNGNISKAASLLDIAPSTIYRKMQSWNET